MTSDPSPLSSRLSGTALAIFVLLLATLSVSLPVAAATTPVNASEEFATVTAEPVSAVTVAAGEAPSPHSDAVEVQALSDGHPGGKDRDPLVNDEGDECLEAEIAASVFLFLSEEEDHPSGPPDLGPEAGAYPASPLRAPAANRSLWLSRQAPTMPRAAGAQRTFARAPPPAGAELWQAVAI